MTDTIIVTPPAVTQVTVSALATANVFVTSPIINTGTSAAPIIGINQASLFTSPTFTGTPLAPTATAGTNSTQIATTAFVGTAVSNLVNSAPATLDTLNELAAALNNDASFSTTIATSLGDKVSLTGSYSNPSWITGLVWSKVSTTPTTLSGYGITDAATSTHTHGSITNAGAIGSTSGLMIKTGASGALTTLAIGSAGQYLQYDGTWSTPSATTYTLSSGTNNGTLKLTSSSGTVQDNIAVTNLGSAAYTASTAYISSTLMTALGDIIYGGASGAATKLLGNTTTTKKFLRQTGDGTNSAAPAWDTVTKTDVGLGNVENTAISTFTGSSNITTVGTVNFGTWNGTAIDAQRGGTGQSGVSPFTQYGVAYAATTSALAETAAGTSGQVLISTATVPAWATPFFMPRPAGDYYVNGQYSSSSGASSIATTTMGYFAIYLPAAQTLTSLGFYAATTGTSSIYQLGLYSNNPATNKPNTLVKDFTNGVSNQLAVSATGYNATSGTSYALTTPGWYWVGIQLYSGTGATFNTLSTTNLGLYASIMPNTTASVTILNTHWTQTVTAAQALPTTAGSLTVQTAGAVKVFVSV
jgi:hypothetical protein